ncbi:hemoglobin subunit alpha-5-like [Pelobates fuscus]|uniref:hemoglobin subunit alpha-5-like n=1 Tax=Pelobates fuscus TaxID=191477 RepID=UPI002FE4AEBD
MTKKHTFSGALPTSLYLVYIFLQFKTALSAVEKEPILPLWGKIADQADEIGAEVLERMILSYPQTKLYFKDLDLSHGSQDLRTIGGQIMNAIANAAGHLHDLSGTQSALDHLHSFELMANPGNLWLLSHSIQVTLSAHFGAEFTPNSHAACNKFLFAVSSALISKYQ